LPIINKIYQKTLQQSILKTFVIFFVISIVYTFLCSFLVEYFNIPLKNKEDIFEMGKFFKFTLAVIYAPLFETLLFTLLPYLVFSKFSKNMVWFIAITSVLFGLIHTYSVAYVIITFFIGIILNTFFWIVIHKKNMASAFFLTCLFHSLHNLIAFFINDVF
jgi:membrane protease YdiL (CAAX protease family)